MWSELDIQVELASFLNILRLECLFKYIVYLCVCVSVARRVPAVWMEIRHRGGVRHPPVRIGLLAPPVRHGGGVPHPPVRIDILAANSSLKKLGDDYFLYRPSTMRWY